MTLSLIGLCGGGRECLTQGVLDLLRGVGALRASAPTIITRLHADDTVAWLESPEGGVVFNSTFDRIPYPAATGDSDAIVNAILEEARRRDVVYLVPHHPIFCEPASVRIFLTARQESIPLRLCALDPTWSRAKPSDFNTLVEVMARLRDPKTGCPWDREQTPETLKRYLVEEAYEVIEAIDIGSHEKQSEELGDLILQVVFHAQLASEAGLFDANDVISQIVEKLIRRHPHVFGDVSVDGADEVLVNWNKIKLAEKGYEDRLSILDGIPKDLPALMRALEVSKRVVKVGFEWPTVSEVLDKVEEEIRELRAEIASGDTDRAQAELGDLLFTLVNVARQLKVDPEEALRAMTHRFGARFRLVEQHAAESGKSVEQLTLDEMEAAWQAAKARE